ncbi:hypothetical protein IFO69_04995 [Echinicola sp. CAU 1574]|uniref:Photosystem I assembly protein Ycf4 n=1 Tax=Echinicola arenosa TaxID=2774144 RepID=A0ABR9AGX6_9BACT|nr:STM3941 family protein [Echinicola arenosa]MBD8488097.1 hypothetical protein [Echinicola arenosa]
MTQEVKIPYSKLKIVLVFVGSLCFVAIGVMTLLDEKGLTSLMFSSETMNKTIGVLSILFFGTIAVIVPWKLLSKNSGIEINEIGIIDHSNLSSIGLIEWEDIKEIQTHSFKKTSWLLIYTFQPQKYVNKAENGFKRWLLKSNLRTYKTPLSITSTILSVKFKELEKIVMDAFEEKKASQMIK